MKTKLLYLGPGNYFQMYFNKNYCTRAYHGQVLTDSN